MKALKQRIVKKSGSTFASVAPNVASVLEKVPDNVAEVIKSRTGFGYTMTIFIGPSQKRIIPVRHEGEGEGEDGDLNEENYYRNPNNPQAVQENRHQNQQDAKDVPGASNKSTVPTSVSKSAVVQNDSATVRLPYSNMMVSIIPQNALTTLDRQRYKDIKFHTQISGYDLKTLTVTRIDANAHRGWDFDLQLKAYYAKDSIGTHHKEFDFIFKNEESAVTIRLKPNQKLRCLPKALIFKEEQVQMINPAVDIVAKRTPIGRIQGTVKGVVSARPSTNTMAEYQHIRGSTDAKQLDTAIVTFGIGGNIGRPTTPDCPSKVSTTPSKIIYLPLGEFGNKILFKKGTCLATSSDVQIVDSGQLLDSSFQSLVGYGDAFLVTGLALKKIVLRDDQDSVSITDSSLIAFTQDVTIKVGGMDKFKGMILDANQKVRTLTGPGIVWLNYYKNYVVGGSKDADADADADTDDTSPSSGGAGGGGAKHSRGGGMRGRSGLSVRGSSSRMGKSNKDFSDDVSLTSIDPSIRDFVDWDDDDNFSVDETVNTISALDPALENQNKTYDSVSKLEVVQEEVDVDQEHVEQSADVDRDRTVDDDDDSGNDDDGDGSMEEVKLNSMSEVDSRSAATVKRKNPHNDDGV